MAFPDHLGLLCNVERNNFLNTTNMPTICASLFANGVRGIRVFIPYTTTAAMGWSDGSISRWFDQVQWYLTTYPQALLWMDSTDVLQGADLTTNEPATYAHVQAVAAEAARRNLDMERFLLGACNEWNSKKEDNLDTNPLRIKYFAAIRAALPNVFQSWAGDAWDGYAAAENGNLAPPPDGLCVGMLHGYESHNDPSGWKPIIVKAQASFAAIGVQRIFWAELGPSTSYAGLGSDANVTQFASNLWAFACAGGPLGVGCAPWAVTNGIGFRVNIDGGWTLRQRIADSFAYNAQSYAAVPLPGASAPAAPPTPPPAPPPVSSGSASSSGTSTPAPPTSGSSGTAPADPGTVSSGGTSQPIGTGPVAPPASPPPVAPPVSAPPTPVAPAAPILAINSIIPTPGSIVVNFTKATGAPNTIRFKIDGFFRGIVRDFCPDETHTWTGTVSPPLPPGVHNLHFYMDGSAAIADTPFTIAAPVLPPAPPAPAAYTLAQLQSDVGAALAAGSSPAWLPAITVLIAHYQAANPGA